MPSVEINGVRINHLQIDCESGKDCEDLVMIHGLATNLAFWYFSHASAFSKCYRVTLYDLRGHGRSGMTAGGYKPKNMALDLQQLLDYLAIERAHFVAHSFGGVVALNLACIDPGRFTDLVLADTNIPVVRRLRKTINWKFGEKMQKILDQNGLAIDVRDPYFGYKLLSEMALLQIRKVKLSQELEDLISNLMWKKNTRSAVRWLKLMETTKAGEELTDHSLSLDSLRKMNFPILAMYGELSQAMATGEQLLKVWPRADFRRIREAGHFFPIKRPSEFRENCLRFWNGAFINELPQCREGVLMEDTSEVSGF